MSEKKNQEKASRWNYRLNSLARQPLIRWFKLSLSDWTLKFLNLNSDKLF